MKVRSFHTSFWGWNKIYIRRIRIESSRKCFSLHFSPRNDYLVNFSNKTFYGFLSWLVQGWDLIKCKYELNYDGAGKDWKIGDGVKDKERFLPVFRAGVENSDNKSCSVFLWPFSDVGVTSFWKYVPSYVRANEKKHSIWWLLNDPRPYIYSRRCSNAMEYSWTLPAQQTPWGDD